MPQYVNRPISIAGLLAFLFALVMTPLMVFFVSTTLANDSPVWNGTIAGSFASGAGTQANPWKITTAEQLARMRQEINANIGNTSSHYYELTQNITLNNTANWTSWGPSTTGLNSWTPIGNNTNNFRANFDGKHFSVYGVYISTTATFQGLFGYINGATISNVGVTRGYIRAGNATGGIVGYATGACTIKNSHNGLTLLSTGDVGGIVGTIVNATNTVIDSCYNILVSGRRIEGGAVSQIGGIVGSVAASSNQVVTIINCYNAGNVAYNDNSIQTHNTGGIAGTISSTNCRILNCYNSGAVQGSGSSSNPSSTTGGIAGRTSGSIRNSYNTGTMTGYFGSTRGIAGNATAANVTACYFLTDSVHNLSGGGSGTIDQFNTSGTITQNNNGYNGQTLLTALNAWKNNPTVSPPSGVTYESWITTVYPRFVYQAAPVVITTTSPLPGGTVNATYNQTIAATCAEAGTLNRTVVSGSLPGGLSIAAATGVISGTPNTAGTFNFTIRVTNATTTRFAERAFSITIAGVFAGGTGTQQSPYLISNKAQLEWFSFVINNNLPDTVNGGNFNSSTKYYALTASITLNNTSGWQSWGPTTTGLEQWAPIGNSTTTFKARFDGRNNSVFGLYVNESSGAGLFGAIENAAVSNVNVKDGYIRNPMYGAGGIAGGALGTSTITNTSNSATIVSINGAGGIVGHLLGSAVISSSYNTGIVTATADNAGGIAGLRAAPFSANAKIMNSYNTGNVSQGGLNGGGSGGIVGGIDGVMTITNCYNTGHIQTTGAGAPGHTGGIVGYNVSGTIIDSYNAGAVTGVSQVGGIAGVAATNAVITSCYNRGVLTATGSNRGGIVGRRDGSITISNTYYNSTVFSGPQIGNVTGTTGALTTSQMLITGTLDMYMTGLGSGPSSAWIKRLNTATESYYPELKVFATDLV